MRSAILNDCDAVLDVGANVGQWAHRVRSCGWAGRLISFEPLPTAIPELQELAERDPLWEVVPVASGSVDGSALLNIAEQGGAASSLYEIHGETQRLAPNAKSSSRVSIPIRRLDTSATVSSHDRLFLKMDVQGHELEVLRGAERLYPQIYGLEVEASLVPVYKGQPGFMDIVVACQDLGFRPVQMDPEFVDPETSQLLQINILFCRDSNQMLSRFN